MNKRSVSGVGSGFVVVFGFVSFWIFCSESAPRATAQSTDVLTCRNDVGRTGQNLHEEILTLSNVNSTNFGLLRVLDTDGKVDAQPLYAAGVSLPGGGVHNVLFVATEHDSVYAFDADSTNLFWKVSMLGVGEMPSDNLGCGQVSPEIGVTATPVIDRALGANGTMFVVAFSKNGTGSYIHRVHALDLSTGADLVTPTTVVAKFKGTGANSDGTNVIFNPSQYVERCGLLLLGGVVYTAWSSHCDSGFYTGWVMGYDEHTLAQTSVLNVTPNGSDGAIWMAGDGLAADGSSNIFFLDGNGTFDTTLTANGFPANHDYGNAFVKLSTGNNVLAVADYFAMSTTVIESAGDGDLGSGGALVLPDMIDGLGQTRQLAVGAGKNQNIYLVERSNMGKFNPANDNAIYQELDGVLGGGLWAMPAYFNGTLYYGAVGHPIVALPFQNARLTNQLSSQTSGEFGFPGTTPSISANGSLNGIVWALENLSPSVLHAYAATNLGVEIYNSNQAANSRDHFGSGNKFVTPMIASARVYAGTPAGVGVFGLLNESTLPPLQAWRDSHFGNPSNVGAGANGASPSGDGVPNLLKYGLGLNPNTPATRSQLPTGGIIPNIGQNYLTITVNRIAKQTDITYIVEVSGDLRTWVSGSPNTVTLTDTATLLVARDNTPAPSATERFIRLRVTNP
jgi:hypothetical protein